jgi:hypothetical protein
VAGKFDSHLTLIRFSSPNTLGGGGDVAGWA